jgi:F1F0 ATPase subunit 2
MNEILHVLLAFITGAALGVMFFLGLWLTIQKIATAKTPGLLMMISFLLRTGITLLGFYYVSFNNPELLLICLAGFILARIIVKRFTRSKNKIQYEA